MTSALLNSNCPGAGDLRRVRTEDIVLTLTVEAAKDAAQAVPAAGTIAEVSSEQLLARIVKSLEDSKAEEIVQIDLRGKTAMGDFMVICSGRSSRQVASISEKLADTLKSELGRLSKMEGKDAGDWVLIDTGDVIVHVFRPEVREFYQLEKMWLSADDVAKLAAQRD